jgi:hypothetical protein
MITAKEARDLIKSDERIEKIVEEEIINAAKLGERSVKIEFPFTVTVSAFEPVLKQLLKSDFQVFRYSSDFNKRYVTYITVTW